VYDSTGAILARADTPLRFDVYQIGEDFILGRWRNEDDVEFIHAYELTRTPATPIPVAPQETPADELEEIDTEEFLRIFRSALRNLVTAQERHYALNRTYTRNVTDFETFDFGEFMLDIVSADNRGWVGVGSHPRFPLICAMAIAYHVPPGWAEGMPLCAEGKE
jgi:hypothetical protein